MEVRPRGLTFCSPGRVLVKDLLGELHCDQLNPVMSVSVPSEIGVFYATVFGGCERLPDPAEDRTEAECMERADGEPSDHEEG